MSVLDAPAPGRPAGQGRLQDVRRRLRQTGGRRRKVRGLIELLRPYRGRVAVMMVALLLATAAALAPAPLAKLAVTEIGKRDLGSLDLIVVLFLASAALYGVATYVQTYLVGWVGQRALQDLRLSLFRHLQTLSVGFYGRNRTGVIISRMSNDIEALNQLVTDGITTLFQSSLTLVGTLVILLVIDWKLALIVLAVVPILMIGSLLFRIASADAYKRTREAIASISAHLQETLSGVRVVRTFAQEPRHQRRFEELNEVNRGVNMTTVRLNASYFPAVDLLSTLTVMAILIVGGLQALHSANPLGQIGTIVAFIAAVQNFFDPIQALSQFYTTYQSGMAALDKIFELLDEQPDVADAPGAPALGRVRGELTFEGVSFRYGAGDDAAWALRDVDLSVPPGQTVALVGATGAGKSTLAKLAARFHDPSEGRVLIDGHDLREVTQGSLRAQMGIVPQEGFLFSGTVGENIAFGRPDASAEEIAAAAHAVGADEFIARLGDPTEGGAGGYDTQVGERGSQLSAGQRQLVAFARALIADPRVLILDEATSNVDIHTETRIEQGLRRLLSGRTAIVIAHRLSTIRHAGRIVVLDGGRIVEQGTHEELIAAEGSYWRLYRDWAAQAAA